MLYAHINPSLKLEKKQFALLWHKIETWPRDSRDGRCLALADRVMENADWNRPAAPPKLTPLVNQTPPLCLVHNQLNSKQSKLSFLQMSSPESLRLRRKQSLLLKPPLAATGNYIMEHSLSCRQIALKNVNFLMENNYSVSLLTRNSPGIKTNKAFSFRRNDGNARQGLEKDPVKSF